MLPYQQTIRICNKPLLIHHQQQHSHIHLVMSNYITLVLILLLVLILAASIVIGHLTTFYSGVIKATYSGVIVSLIMLSLVGLLLVERKIPLFNKHRRLIISYWLVTIAFITVSAVITIGLLWIYAIVSLCLTAMYLLISLYQSTCKKKERKPGTQNNRAQTLLFSTSSKADSLDIDQEPIGMDHQPLGILASSSTNSQLLTISKPSALSKCCTCCYVACAIISLIILIIFTSVSIIYYHNLTTYPPYGEILQITSPNTSYKYQVHYYCIGKEHESHPTIILQHGGGSNSIAFLGLAKFMAQEKKFKVCSYDRLGYGRSSLIPRFLTLEERAFITHQVITNILGSHSSNKDIIVGGWSAGVQLAQVYYHIYQQNIKGLIFMDGYPDYLTLQAIYDNRDQPYKNNALSLSLTARIFESLGTGFIVGSSDIPDPQSNHYYKAYYQTGYFWQSQYFDISNPYSPTEWLTNHSNSTTVPYPNSTIALNWPDIKVPLLIMPASSTVNQNDEFGPMFMKQCEKYLQKCSSPKKKIKVMEGDHSFVLNSPDKVGSAISDFIANN